MCLLQGQAEQLDIHAFLDSVKAIYFKAKQNRWAFFFGILPELVFFTQSNSSGVKLKRKFQAILSYIRRPTLNFPRQSLYI
jgi:hypothetical protein